MLVDRLYARNEIISLLCFYNSGIDVIKYYENRVQEHQITLLHLLDRLYFK